MSGIWWIDFKFPKEVEEAYQRLINKEIITPQHYNGEKHFIKQIKRQIRNNKLSLREPEFYINEKKRTVTCKLSGFLFGPCDYRDWMMPGINFPQKNYSVIATAHCNKNDVFDIERGKRIAMSKAENSIYSKAAIEVSNVCEKLDFLRDACNSFFKKSLKCQAHNIDYIDSLTMMAHPKYSNKPLPEKHGIVVEHIKK